MDISTFDQRLGIGNTGATELSEILSGFGYSIVPFGQENYIGMENHDALRYINDDPTVRAIRFAPDFIAINGKCTCYWEAKVNTTPGTRNFTIEKACYEELMSRHNKGERCVVAFKDTDSTWHANYVERILITRDMSTDRQFARGSRTPYLLIAKGSTERLRDFVSRQKTAMQQPAGDSVHE